MKKLTIAVLAVCLLLASPTVQAAQVIPVGQVIGLELTNGTVTVSGNTAYGIKDRFLRMAGAADATVIIKDNTVTAYKGADEDFIKVTTDSTTLHNYTGSNNQCFK